MFNKIKVYATKNTLKGLEKDIFEYLSKNTNNTTQENKDLAVKYADSAAVKNHHLGQLYKIEALRYTILTQDEIKILEKGSELINKFFQLQEEIETEGYKILCSPKLMEKRLFDCSTALKVESILKILEKELASLTQDVARKRNEKYNPSNSKEIAISNLNTSQKESLTSLGFDIYDNSIITLSNLKKIYHNKLYSVHGNSANITNNYIKELSEAFINVKQAFDIAH